MEKLLREEAAWNGTVIKYYLLSDEGESGCGCYGIRIVFGEEMEEIRHVTESQVSILALLDHLIAGQVTPVTLRDVVEDWLLAELWVSP